MKDDRLIQNNTTTIIISIIRLEQRSLSEGKVRCIGVRN